MNQLFNIIKHHLIPKRCNYNSFPRINCDCIIECKYPNKPIQSNVYMSLKNNNPDYIYYSYLKNYSNSYSNNGKTKIV